MNEWTIVFLDSSIQIARTIRENRIKARINTWLSRYKLKVTGIVALQEFKRRVLRDVAYLLTKLNQTGSYLATLHFITSVLPVQQQRRKGVCLPILHSILPGSSDQELTERARLYFRTLVVCGEKHFIKGVDSVLSSIECYWARVPIREKKRYVTYDLGETKCTKSKRQCQIGNSLQAKRAVCEGLLEFLKTLPPQRMTAELQSARAFLDRVVNGNALQNIYTEEPCLAVGDLLLALESNGMPDFYTMNYRESQAYCDFLQQNLTIRPNNPDHDERVHFQTTKPWPNP